MPNIQWSDFYENAKCPDCGEDIPISTQSGDVCSSCEHVFLTFEPAEQMKIGYRFRLTSSNMFKDIKEGEILTITNIEDNADGFDGKTVRFATETIKNYPLDWPEYYVLIESGHLVNI